MRDFFSSRKFKILLALAALMLAFVIRAAWTDGLGTFGSQLLGAAVTPFQQLSSGIAGSASSFLQKFVLADQVSEENELLREEIRQLNEKLVDYEATKQQNQLYEKFLQITDDRPDFEFVPSSVIGRDPDDRFYSFTIDKGSLAGVSPRDPVIDADGLVGIVAETGLTYSRVITVLDAGLRVGAYVDRTRDVGMTSGTVELALSGQCKLGYLDRESGAAVGDTIVTSGVGGIFPKDLIIGRIREIKMENHGISLYAVVEPMADIENVKDVFIITGFEGQGDVASSGDYLETLEGEVSSGAESPEGESALEDGQESQP
ncbi:MAG: rod shape-determining protein MreC [Oscillospiraceae bacterium]|nr:rod shape-determining protein MreC [Oscillospiraceae bacterium]